jgi:chromosome segregation ATPase
MARRLFSVWCFWLLVFFLVQAPAGWCEDEQPTETWQSLLTEALLISQRLEALNEQLSSELTASRSHSAELQKTLEKLLNEHVALKSELAELRRQSESLSGKLQTSKQELISLQEQLKKAEASSDAFEKSFSDYKLLAETKIKSLKRQRNLAAGGGILALILAVIFGSR